MIDAALVEKLNAELTESNVDELMQKYGLTIDKEHPFINCKEVYGVAENRELLIYDKTKLNDVFYLIKESEWRKEMQWFLEEICNCKWHGCILTAKQIKKCLESLCEIESEELYD